MCARRTCATVGHRPTARRENRRWPSLAPSGLALQTFGFTKVSQSLLRVRSTGAGARGPVATGNVWRWPAVHACMRPGRFPITVLYTCCAISYQGCCYVCSTRRCELLLRGSPMLLLARISVAPWRLLGRGSASWRWPPAACLWSMHSLSYAHETVSQPILLARKLRADKAAMKVQSPL